MAGHVEKEIFWSEHNCGYHTCSIYSTQICNWIISHNELIKLWLGSVRWFSRNKEKGESYSVNFEIIWFIYFELQTSITKGSYSLDSQNQNHHLNTYEDSRDLLLSKIPPTLLLPTDLVTRPHMNLLEDNNKKKYFIFLEFTLNSYLSHMDFEVTEPIYRKTACLVELRNFFQ